MLDREKIESILANRFPGAAIAQVAAAANAIMGLADRRTRVAAGRRPFRAPASAFTTISVSSRIEAPLKRVFDVFTDVEHAPDRVSGIVGTEMLTVGPFGPGTRWRETRKLLGRVDTADMEVTAFEKYRTYTVCHQKGGIRVETTFSFEPAGDATLVSIEFALDGAGLPPGLLTPFNWAITTKVQQVLKADLADLKERLEA
jgi:Polyketide cyclase / dehydrase and lipid transport